LDGDVAQRPSEHTVLTRADYEGLAAFRYALRRYLAFAETGARSVGLTSQQHQALLAIKAHTMSKPMVIGDLAAELLIKHHSAVELLGRLEKVGLTQRRSDPDDGRKVLVSLTEAGEEILAALSTNNLRELRHIAPAFSGLLDRLEEISVDETPEPRRKA
jgi:DNA-binding MarR family transcriptional regulator